MTVNYVSWPPPGLERLQGTAGSVARSIGTGSALLLFPLLSSVGTRTPYWSLGPFGEHWWVATLLEVVGLLMLLVGLDKLLILLFAAARAARMGHGLLTVAHVAADGSRDTGFLLQRARWFAELDEKGQRSLVLLRLCRAGTFLAGALWLPLGLLLSLVLASRASLSPPGLWILTLLPASVFLLAAVYCRLYEMLVMHRIRKAGREKADEEVREDADKWINSYSFLGLDGSMGRGYLGRGRVMGSWAAALSVFTVLLLLGTSAVMLLGATGPLVADVVIPRYEGIPERALLGEAMRRYRLPADPAITALEAGEAAHVFIARGAGESELLRPAVRTYDRWWKRGIPASRIVEMFEPAARRRLTQEQREFLEPWVNLPAAHEFAILGRAEHADFFGARWKTPFPRDLRPIDMPIPRYTGFSDGARAQLATAVVQLANGDPAAAERTLREVLSAGLLLMDDGIHLIDNLIGIVAVSIATGGLESFYRATGRTIEADHISESQQQVDRASRLARVGSGPLDTESAVREMARVARDRAALRGLRWEYVLLVASVTPCINLNRAVYGPDEEYGVWLNAARASLIQHEGEEALFDLFSRGLMYSGEDLSDKGLLWRLYGIVLGNLGLEGGCGAILAER